LLQKINIEQTKRKKRGSVEEEKKAPLVELTNVQQFQGAR
jgi:hypothetical protein